MRDESLGSHMQDESEFQKYEYLAERRRRGRTVMVIVPGIAAAILLLSVRLLDRDSFHMFIGLPREIFVVAALVLFAMSAGSLVMTYLQTGFARNRLQEASELAQQAEMIRLRDQIERIKSSVPEDRTASLAQIEELRGEVARLSQDLAGIDETSKMKLVELVTNQVQQGVTETLWNEIQKKAEAAIQSTIQFRELSKQFEDARSRLAQEVSALGRRGNLNLSLGIITTIVGLVFLGYFVFTSGDPAKQPVDFAIHFLPRLTLVLFIEVFAYFFLRLYKSSLAEIKYFQNEVTNIEAKYIALKTSLNAGDAKMIGDVVGQLASTERNHVLEKGQTTVEIEKSRLDREGLSEVAKQLAAVFSKKS